MKITYANNPAGDYVNIRNAISAAEALDSDVLIFGGDLAGNPFSTPKDYLEEQRNSFINLNVLVNSMAHVFRKDNQNMLSELKEDNGSLMTDVRSIYDMLKSSKDGGQDVVAAQSMIDSLCRLYSMEEKDILEKLSRSRGKMSSEIAKSYSELSEIAEQGMKEQYDVLDNMIADARNKVPYVFILHGGADLECIEDLENLAECNLHMRDSQRGKVSGKEKIQIAGYGSSPVCPPDVPSELTEPYSSEAMCRHFTRSEPKEFGIPYAIVTQMPPFHRTVKEDRGEKKEFMFGDQNLLRYIKKEQPDLVLTGHRHMDPSAFEIGYSKVANPGSLNRQAGGNFAVIDVEDEPAALELYQITDPDRCRAAKMFSVDYRGEKPEITDHTKDVA